MGRLLRRSSDGLGGALQRTRAAAVAVFAALYVVLDVGAEDAAGIFLEHHGVQVGGVGADRGRELRLGVEVGRGGAFGWAVLHAQLLAVLGVRAVPDLADAAVVVRRETVQDPVQPLGLVLRAFGEPLVADVGDRQQLADGDAAELLQRFRLR